MDDAKFFAAVRESLFGGSLAQKQVDGCNALLTAGAGMDFRQLAYVLATAFHETAKTMQPITEYGSSAYLKSKPYYPYIGRGYVQLTWKANYEKAGKELGVDLAGRPDLALEPDVAAKIIIRGMSEGWFTGKKLSDYIDSSTMLLTVPPKPKVDYLGARRIVNGTDKAGTIAGYAAQFETALSEAGFEAPSPAPADPPASSPVRPDPSPGKAVAVAGIAAVVAAAVAWGEHVLRWLGL